MPSGKTHLIAGALFSGYVLYQINAPLEYIFIGALAGLVPDVDHKRAILGRFNLLNRIKRPTKKSGQWRWVSIMKHRGFTHSFLSWVISSAVWFSIHPWVGITWTIGYGSHLFLDWFTPMGIQLMWPKKKYYSLRR